MASRDNDENELDLRQYLRVLRRRKGVIALSVAVTMGIAIGASLLQTPVYQGRAEVLLQAPSTETLFDPTSGQRTDPTRAVQTEIQVLKSRPVRDAVKRKLNFVSNVSAAPVGQTDVIRVSASSSSPRRAADVANAYATSYIDFRRTQSVDDLLAASQEVQKKINDIDGQIAALDSGGSASSGVKASPQGTAERDSLISQEAVFKQKLDQLQVDAALKTGGAQLVTPAIIPTSPIAPRPIRSAVVALALGLGVGLALAFLFEYLDDSIKSKEDLDLAAHDVPNIGLIPTAREWKDREEPKIVSLVAPSSSIAEAYRTLRTSIQFLGIERPVQVLQLTSPSASEGKTTTLANLGVTLASAGAKVVLVCCDLRRPRIHEFFKLDNKVGFSSVLLGDVPLSAAIQSVPDVPGLSVLASGPPPPNPSELLASSRTTEVIQALRREFDLVLIDCPPVLPVTDAALLSSRVDGTIIVVSATVTTGRQLARTIELLQQVGAPLVGTVLNGAKSEDGYGYGGGYGYGYGYGHGAPEETTDEAPLIGQMSDRGTG